MSASHGSKAAGAATTGARSRPSAGRARWTRAADGTLEGTLERRQRGKVVGNERMAIASADGKAVLAAAVPEDQESMRYVETARGDRSITFERAADVYPHRLRYWREGKQLVAEISRRDGSEAFRWRYRRVGR
ncbi:MAG: DUF6265 family protein [Sphingomonas sp.]